MICLSLYDFQGCERSDRRFLILLTTSTLCRIRAVSFSMKLDRFIRLALGFLILLVFVIAIAALLFVTESALNVWDRLVQGPRLLLYGYLAFMAALIVGAVWLIGRLLVRRKIPEPTSQSGKLSKSDIEARLREADDIGVDVADAQAELRELASRQDARSVHLCFLVRSVRARVP